MPRPLPLVLSLTAALLLAAIAAPPSADARRWGEEGHRMIGQLAAERLPASVPDFFRSAGAQLGYLNPEPDRWRTPRDSALDVAYGGYSPDHYVNLELVPGAAFRAATRHDFVDSLHAHGLAAGATGVAHYRVLELTDRLRTGFQLWRRTTDPRDRRYIEERIVNDAGILGHYVADLSNPHHTTIHHNGWVGDNPRGFTTERGFHSRFESQYVRANIRPGHLAPLVPVTPRTLTPLRDSLLAYIQRSHGELERLYALDLVEPFGVSTRGAEHRRFTAERLAAGAEMLRDIWWTAWESSS